MIDDLIKFCLAEIAYEGELGCSVDRLKALVALFYEQQPIKQVTVNATEQGAKALIAKKKQNVDDKYLAYIYSLLTSHSSIIIGTVPPDSPAVWIAPPPHKKGTTPARPPVTLNSIDAKGRSLDDLKAEYGDGLRIAVDKTTCFVSLTGSHNRPSKLSDMVYTTLQIIARTREKGIAIKDLGPITGYDPKSIFYQIQQLTSLNLVVKLSRVPSINWAIHRRFYDRNELWQKIKSGEDGQPTGDTEADDGEAKDDSNAEENADDMDRGNSKQSAELLANVPQLRLRVLRLLEKSKAQTHQYTNLIIAAGYPSPTKQQRRFFTSRVNQMVEEGLMEKINIVTTKGKAACLRLTEKGKEYLANPPSTSGEIGADGALIKSNQDNVLLADVDEEEFIWTENNRLLRNFGLQRQIIEQLDSRPDGVTITELSHALGFLDRRTVEQVLTRLCTRVPPKHLANLHPITVMETAGKIRRQRYFTLAHYQTLLKQQNLPDGRYDWIHMNDIGGFSFVDESMIWKTQEDWMEFIDSFQTERRVFKGVKDSPMKKKKTWKNPVIDGVVKRGRPKKEWRPTNKAVETRNAAEPEDELQSEAEVLDVISPTPKARKGKPTKPKPTKDKVVDAPATPINPAPLPESLRSVKGVIWVDERDSRSPTAARAQAPQPSPVAPAISPIQVATPNKGKGKKRTAASLDEAEEPKGRKKRKVVNEPPSETRVKDPLADAMEVLPLEQTLPDASVVGTENDQSGSGPSFVDSSVQQSGSSMAISRPPSPDKRRTPKQPKPRPTNVSALRRHQDILDLLQANSGIMQQNFEMSFLLRDHVQNQVNQGVQTGQDAGFLSDKKTIQRAVEALEEMGQLNVLKTAIVDGNRRNSLQQPTTIIYLPEKSQEEVNSFIEGLHKPYKSTHTFNTTGPVVDAGEYSSIPKPRPRKQSEKKDKELGDGMHEVDVLSMMGPRKQFLEDRQTVAQLSGFLLGRMRRAQELHLYTLNHILSETPAPTVVSVEQRIVSSSFWAEDYPLGSFCAIIPMQTYIPYLDGVQHDPNRLNQPLKSLDVPIQRALKVQHARTRHRLLDLLRILSALGVVTALREDADGSIVVDDPSGTSAGRAFEVAQLPPGANVDLPEYWKFNEQAPLWLFMLAKFTSQKIEETPSFYGDVSLSSVDDATTYWSLLRKLCDRQGNFSPDDAVNNSTTPKPFTISAAELASLCNHRSWTSNYCLSKVQQEYLRGMIDVRTLSTPLDDPAQLMQVSHIACAPQHVVYEYFSVQKEKLAGAAERTEKKKFRPNGPSQQATKRSLAAKAEKHLQSIGRQWDEMVAELVQGDLTEDEEEQLRPLRSRYITVGGQVDSEKVKALISNIVRNPVNSAKKRHKKLTKKTLLPRSVEVEHIEQAIPQLDVLFTQQPAPVVPVDPAPVMEEDYPPLPPSVKPHDERTVASMIQSMGQIKHALPPPKKKPGETRKDPIPRRGRFKWTDEYDDLLRDTVAIIKARCRGKGRNIQWQPVEIIFPPVRANNLRIRFQKYVVQPGAQSYMDRLEQAWYNLWQTHKGRPELPDEDPSKVEGCDLILHVEFLRKYLDKRNIMAESSLATSSLQPDIDLLASVEDIEREYEVEPVDVSTFESIIRAYWGESSPYLNERGHALITGAFTEVKERPRISVPLKLAVAQTVIQMVVATDQEQYMEEHATSLLRPFGDELAKQAADALIKRGVINRLSKTKAGRSYKMVDSNAEDLSGLFPLQRCEDAAALEKIHEEEPDEWRTWPLVPTDGEMTTLLRRASNHTVDFKIQLPDLKLARDSTQWSSRKIQDEMLESQVAVLFDQPVPSSSRSTPDLEESDDGDDKAPKSKSKKQAPKADKDHGVTLSGEKAACSLQVGDGTPINCSKCLDIAQVALLKKLPRKDVAVTKDLLSRLMEAGEDGVAAEEVWAWKNAESVVDTITTSTTPLAFWSGYNQCKLISTRFLGSYAVMLSGAAQEDEEKAIPRLVIPRRWVNLTGEANSSTWKAALRAVVGLLLLRPLVDHNRMIRSFEKAYDRLDMLAVLRFLEDCNILKRAQDMEDSRHAVGEMTLGEERRTFWELNGNFDWADLL